MNLSVAPLRQMHRLLMYEILDPMSSIFYAPIVYELEGARR